MTVQTTMVDTDTNSLENHEQQISFDAIREEPKRVFALLRNYLPTSLAVREIMRLRSLAEIGSIKLPLLDVGCGDGLFWEVAFKDAGKGKKSALKGLFGIDINSSELKLASRRFSEFGAQANLLDISSKIGDEQSFHKDQMETFHHVLCNCSIEHVTQLKESLTNIYQLIKSGGTLSLFVPAPNWSNTMQIKQLLSKISYRLGSVYGACFDGFFQHHHLYPAWVWQHLLEGIGFKNIKIQGLGSKKASMIFERRLPFALISFLFKSLFKRYPCLPGWSNWNRTRNIKDFLNEVHDGSCISDNLHGNYIVEFFITCQK